MTHAMKWENVVHMQGEGGRGRVGREQPTGNVPEVTYILDLGDKELKSV